MTTKTPPKPKSRAVTRTVAPGNWMFCAGCSETLKFRAGRRQVQVIANVYSRGKWKRVEHWHPDCYVDAGDPYGPSVEKLVAPG